MPTALILGCSHAAGAQMHLEPGFDTTDYTPVQIAEYGAQHSYPVLLAKMLGYTAHNHAISGGSNDAMYRIYAEQEQHHDLIIACWTGSDRGEVYHSEHEYWVPINVGHGDSFTKTPNDILKQGRNVLTKLKNFEQYEDYGKQWLTFEGNEQRGFNNKVKNILALNSLAKSKDTRVINLESFGGFYPPRFSYPTEIVWATNKMEDEFINFCTINCFPKESSGHYFKPAHQAYAEYTKQKVDKL
tara:strand:+ start:681 stop:1409 length:729 start_codon:yes stop_codon:yes gene_type:complete